MASKRSSEALHAFAMTVPVAAANDDAFAEAGGILLRRKDEDAALAVFDRISDPDVRAGSLKQAFSEWQSDAPAAAKAWLEKTDKLTPELKARLLEKPRTRAKVPPASSR